MKFIKPKIVVSRCLEFDTCRYDGQKITSKYIYKLKDFIEFKPICPEVEIGMGTPRDPIRIIKVDDKMTLYQEHTKKDFTKKMNDFSDKFMSKINLVDGFILKSRSPSCGINTAKIYTKNNPAPIGKGSGLFASKVIEDFPNHPREDEKRLNNPYLREHFFTSIFTLADFRSVKNMKSLYDYHAKHKYLFMSYNQIQMRKMGKIAANEDKHGIEIVIKNYYNSLLTLLSKRARYTSNINIQMHVMGYFKKFISNKEKSHFLKLIDDYRMRKIHLSTINQLLLSWVLRFENEYLEKQSFFMPFPSQLIEKETSRFL
tara:strand:- start:561 stop:1505 length:945 start_codon:yes stop_codon:yes gene_type:complete